MGKIAFSGPFANLCIALTSFIFYIYLSFEVTLYNDFIGFISLINIVLATFNLLPIGPLDGIKILKWNVNIWLFSFIVSIILTMIIFSRVII
jgi:Zn-dependent protease